MTPSDESTFLASAEPVPEPGSVIGGRYVVEGLLGKGGMSVVLLARDSRLGHPVALKLLRGPQDRRSQHVRRFLREARTIAKLRSDHVVRVLDVDPEASPPYLAMERLEGRTVAELLAASGRLSPDLALRILVQACRGVADAHALGILHRDLKPSNLFLARSADGTHRVKVIDFGISKPLAGHDEPPDLTSSGQILGSPRYMPPEQVRAGSRVDLRADVWALGAILYELLAGVSPFEAPTLADTIARIVRDAPTPLRACAPEVPERLAAVVALCLSKDPALRPPDVRALLQELESMTPAGPLRLSESLATYVDVRPSATTESTALRSWSVSLRPDRRRPRRLVVALSLLGALAGCGWALSRSVERAATSSGRATSAPHPTPPEASMAAALRSVRSEAPLATSSSVASPWHGVPARASSPRRLAPPTQTKTDDDLALERRE